MHNEDPQDHDQDKYADEHANPHDKPKEARGPHLQATDAQKAAFPLLTNALELQPNCPLNHDEAALCIYRMLTQLPHAITDSLQDKHIKAFFAEYDDARHIVMAATSSLHSILVMATMDVLIFTDEKSPMVKSILDTGILLNPESKRRFRSLFDREPIPRERRPGIDLKTVHLMDRVRNAIKARIDYADNQPHFSKPAKPNAPTPTTPPGPDTPCKRRPHHL